MLPQYWQGHVSVTERNRVTSTSAGDLLQVVLTEQKWEKREPSRQRFNLSPPPLCYALPFQGYASSLQAFLLA